MAKGKNARALFEVVNAKGPNGLQTPSWWYKGRSGGTAPEPSPHPSPAPAAPTFRFTYTSVAIAGAAVVVLIIIAFLLGRARRPTVSEQSTAELMQGPAHPEVMDIKRGEAGLTPAPTPPPALPQPVAVNGKRTVGLNYVVVQSYPEKKDALEACDVLAKAGIPATIEQGLRGLKSDWYTVVGTEGFAHTHTREYESYLRKIERVSDSFAKKKSFKAFQPIGYKWDRP